jgi:predicted nucleic acid-binding protein
LIVVDASVALAWFFEDELDDFSRRSAQRVLEESTLVPPIFPTEFANGLYAACRRGRISESKATEALIKLASLPLSCDTATLDLREQLAAAKKYKLSIYDSMYLVLARSHRATLLTRDNALALAAKAAHVSVAI